MKKIKTLIVITLFFLTLFSNSSYCLADDLVWNEVDRETIFNMAKEQDRFILLFAGNYEGRCRYCTWAFGLFNDPSGPLRTIVDDNYVTWFGSLFLEGTSLKNPEMSEFESFIAGYLAIRNDPNDNHGFPILCVINPDNPDEDATEYWGTMDYRTNEELLFAITPPDLFAGQELTWHEDEEEVFTLAKQQGKPIFKLVGKATSPNSKKVIKQLTAEPLKPMLSEHFILWFSSDTSGINVNTYAETNSQTLPYIYIINPDEPEVILSEVKGYQDVEKLIELVIPFTVSNEIIELDNKVTVFGNMLQIANHINSEQIQLFTLNGQRIAIIRKNDYSIKIDASHFPKGTLIVYSSSGWSQKIILQ